MCGLPCEKFVGTEADRLFLLVMMHNIGNGVVEYRGGELKAQEGAGSCVCAPRCGADHRLFQACTPRASASLCVYVC